MTRQYEGHLRRLELIYASKAGEREIRETIESTEQMMHLARQRRSKEIYVKNTQIAHDNLFLHDRLAKIKEGHYVRWQV